MLERKQLTMPEGWRSLVGTVIWLAAYVVATGTFAVLRDRSIFLAPSASSTSPELPFRSTGGFGVASPASTLSFPHSVLIVRPLPIMGAAIVTFWLVGVADSWGLFGARIRIRRPPPPPRG